MTTANAVAFSAISIPILSAPGEHRLQVAGFFRKRLYVGAISQPDGSTAPGLARILRYYPGADRWEVVCETTVEAPNWPKNHRQHRKFPLELGWRSMTVVPTGAGQDALCLSLLCPANPRLFHSEDGVRFETLPDWSEIRPFGLVHSFRGWLFAAPIGAMSDGIAEKTDGGASLYVVRDPRVGKWRSANVPGFGDLHNQVIHCLQVFNDWLYAAVGNPFAGFQLWRTQALGDPPFAWELVVEKGAQRFTLNSAAASMAVFQNALYLGTGVPETERPQDEAAGCEMIRVLPNGRWELVMGQPRFSPIGLQVPVSAHGPGFDDPRNTLLPALASSGDSLYAGIVRREPDAVSGFQIWQTRDGEIWRPLVAPDSAASGAHDLRVLLAMPKFLLAAGAFRSDPANGVSEPFLWFGQSEQ